MDKTEELKTHVTELTKDTVRALARQQGMTEAAWLRTLVEGALQAACPTPAGERARDPGRLARVNVRVTPDDRELLEARAGARHMPPATYVAFFLRAHLRSLAPLPSAELSALKRAVAELGAIGRNINQIARIAYHSGRAAGPAHQDLVALLEICEALRDHVKSFIKANLASWESGHAASTNR